MHSSNHQQNNTTTPPSKSTHPHSLLYEGMRQKQPEGPPPTKPATIPMKLAKAAPQPKNPSTKTLHSKDVAPSSPGMDDLDIMLFHQDFPHLLAIAAKVKAIRQKIAAGPHTPPRPTYRAKTALQPNDVLLAVERMQHVMTKQTTPPPETIPRGRYPITDSLMEDAMLLLQKEHEAALQWYHQPHGVVREGPPPRVPDPTNHKRGRTSPPTTNAASPITVKYAKWQTDVLMQWMIDHKDSPFPDADAVAALAEQTGLSHSQVVNWTTNVRKRNRKATCENGKKPHHFLDFLFLVHDRETKQADEEAAGIHPPFANAMKSAPVPPAVRMSLFPKSYIPPPTSKAFVEPPAMIPSLHIAARNASPPIKVAPAATTILEPIPYETKSNDAILVDFADGWLMAQEQPPHKPGHILPSVTADSHEDAPPPKISLARNDSFSLGSLEEEVEGDEEEDVLLMQWSGTDGFM